MERIVIIGNTGSGKSTLAKKLAELHGLTYVDLDNLFHMPGWQPRPTDDFRRMLDEATQSEKWVLAGNYIEKTQDISWSRADTLIWLDMPFLDNFCKLFQRTVKRIWTGESICNGNKETFFVQFCSGQSLFLWYIQTFPKNSSRFRSFFDNPQNYPNLRLIRLRSYQECEQFIENINLN